MVAQGAFMSQTLCPLVVPSLTNMIRSHVMTALGSTLILIGAVWLACRCKLLPFVALFAFDAPGATEHLTPWLLCLALIAAPLSAVGAAICAFINVAMLSRKMLAIAAALSAYPLALYLLFVLPMGR